MKHLTLTGLAGLALAACTQRPADTAYLAGHMPDYKGQDLLLVLYGDPADAQAYDTLEVSPDGAFFASIPTTQRAERSLYVDCPGEFRYKLKCYLAPGDTLHMALKGEVRQETWRGQVWDSYVPTPEFRGVTARENDYLNLPRPDFRYRNADGTPVSFRDFMEQVEERQDFLRGRLDGTCEEFVAQQTPVIDNLKRQHTFDYYRAMKEEGFDVGQDVGFRAYINSIDMEDTLNIALVNYVTPTYLRVRFRLDSDSTLYAGEHRDARFYRFIQDSIQNPTVRERLADPTMQGYLGSGVDDNLPRLFELYKSVSGTSALYRDNEAAYTKLARLMPGSPASDFEMQDVEGRKVRFLDVIGQGKVTYVDFWATWCGPCCAEIPHMEKLVEKYKGNPKIEFISISMDQELEKWHAKLDADKPAWRQFVVPGNFESECAKAYNIMGIPRFMVFDGEGRIITINAERPSALGNTDLLDGYLK